MSELVIQNKKREQELESLANGLSGLAALLLLATVLAGTPVSSSDSQSTNVAEGRESLALPLVSSDPAGSQTLSVVFLLGQPKISEVEDAR
jgi:hypothetical protein